MLRSNRYYLWYVLRRKLSEEWQRQLNACYKNSYTAINDSNCNTKEVIFVCNGAILSGGLADRLKGILSTYILCKEKGWQFKLLFNDPFPMEIFMVPNTYDWTIDKENVFFDRSHSTPITMEITEESPYQARKQKQWLSQQIAKARTPQVHIYTNAMFAYIYDFSAAFKELFRPSERLQKTISKQLDALQHSYVSISARFLNVLGDFTDTVQIDPLPERIQQELLNRCIRCIQHCHELNPGKTILVNSDSKTFLKEASKLPYTYVTKGLITHLDTDCNDAETIYERYEKTMIDYLLISEAEIIYRIDGKWLHASGYPLSASRIHNRPFITLNY